MGMLLRRRLLYFLAGVEEAKRGSSRVGRSASFLVSSLVYSCLLFSRFFFSYLLISKCGSG